MKSMKIFASILVPPVGVYMQSGLSKSFWINVPLTLCGIIPGVIHAIWSLTKEKNGIGLDRLMGRS
ncbi:MAG: YqaE/Pmp3 family membrane protein [Bdellovibrionales bacterium]|nr:YqaE/Pmp3 family membrane protein [Bdellovibrionales bacterium]